MFYRDSFAVKRGKQILFLRTGGARKSFLSDEPSDENAGRDYYDNGDKKDYYYYDGRRKREQYLIIPGNGQQVTVTFKTKAARSTSRFKANVSLQGEDFINFHVLVYRRQTI